MKKTNKDNIIETIEEYINSSPIRPVIIWFRQQTIRRRKSHNQMSHFLEIKVYRILSNRTCVLCKNIIKIMY